MLGKYPFPGDLLLTQYGPWRHQSYDGYVAGAIPTKNQYFDVLREIYPWKTLVVSQLKQGVMPFWNPYNFSGAPLLANYQSQVLYPLSLLYVVLPQLTAWTLMVISQPVMGSVFMYLFASEIGLSAVASILAALLFNFSGFASAWIEFTTIWHTILWLPLLLYVVERGIKQKSLTRFQCGVFIFSLYSSITGGHPQDFLNTFLFLLVYTAIRLYMTGNWDAREKIRFSLFPLLFVFLTPFLLAMPQLLPTIELFKNSARVAHDYTGLVQTMLVQWWQTPLIFIADFFGNPATGSSITGDYVGKTLSVGIVGFILSLVAVFSGKKILHIPLFAGVSMIILLLTVRTPLSELFYRYPLPVMSTGTPTRILFLLMFSQAILAGYGYDLLRTQFKNGRIALIVTWSCFALLWVFVILKPELHIFPITVTSFSIMKRALFMATGILFAVSLVLIASKFKKLSLLILVPVCVFELFYGFNKFNPFVPKSFIYPQNQLFQYLQTNTGYDRFWGYGTSEIEANFATQVGVYSADGTDPLNLSWYNQFIHSSSNGKLARKFTRTTRSDAKIASGYGAKDLPENAYRLKVLDLLGVKYIINRSDNPQDDTTFETTRFTPVWQSQDWTVFKNNYAAPRVFLTGDIKFYRTPEDFEQIFFSDTFNATSSILIESEFKKDLDTIKAGSASAQITMYKPNSVDIAVTTSAPQLLFLSDTYDRNWKATIDSKPTTIYKTNYAFRGILVPTGNHTIHMEYYPRLFYVGLVISIATLIISGLMFIFKKNETP